jgi:hypothetical protein
LARRKKIEALPDGKFRAVVFNDAIGFTPALVRACNLTLIKEGGKLTFDFHGTSPENPFFVQRPFAGGGGPHREFHVRIYLPRPADLQHDVCAH